MPQTTTEAHIPTSAEPAPSLGSLIACVTAAIGSDRFPTGERAALKRMAPNEPPGLAFFRFWPRYLGADAPPDAQVLDWSVILAGIALMGHNAHQQRDRRFRSNVTANSGRT